MKVNQSFKPKILKRSEGIVQKSLKDKNDKDYWFVVMNDGKRVFCHSSRFIEPRNPNSIPEGTVVYFELEQGTKDLKTGKDRFFGNDITYPDSNPELLYVTKLKKGYIHFAILTIWNNGHTLSEPEAPQDFRDKIFAASESMVKILKSGDFSNELEDEFLFFFSCLHRDMPIEVSKKFSQFIDDERTLNRYYRNIAYAIGDVSLKWQQELFEKILNAMEAESEKRSVCLNILAIALWRSKKIVLKLKDERSFRILELLKTEFENNFPKIVPGASYRIAIMISRHLEIILAFLRIRTPKNRILYPRDAITEWFVDKLGILPELLKNTGLEIQTYLKFDIKKPDSLNEVHDLIYALRLYLTGDNGANTIIISGVGFDE
jgi:cold shock CspA family protein